MRRQLRPDRVPPAAAPHRTCETTSRRAVHSREKSSAAHDGPALLPPQSFAEVLRDRGGTDLASTSVLYFTGGKAWSRAIFISSTLTRGSPRNPNCRPAVCASTNPAI